MRAVIRDLTGTQLPDHAGLAYERWAPLDPGTGKIPDERRMDWLASIAAIRAPKDYRHAYVRWVASLGEHDACMQEVEMQTRALVGHGNPAPTEVGLTLHRTWGVPLLPGSGLKGLLAHYVDAVLGPDQGGRSPYDPSLGGDLRERAAFQGPTREGRRVVHGPGDAHRAIFGAPAALSDERYAEQGAGEAAGLVVFHDALYVPNTAEGTPLVPDVLTVHQKDYYDSRGLRRGPNDFTDPNPVSFLTVKPGARFLIALGGDPTWAAFTLPLLLEALVEWGIGGKTSSGYGRIVGSTGRIAAEVRDGAPPSAGHGRSGEIDDFARFLGTDSANQREKIRLARETWLPKLAGLSLEERKAAVRELRATIKSPKLKEDLAALVSALIREGSP